MTRTRTATDALSGDWHLVDASAPDQPLPQHRMDLRFEGTETQFRAAILNRVNGEEIPLAKAVWNGADLRLQMYAPHGQAQANMPWLVMTRIGARFEGRWHSHEGDPMGRALKLIQAGV